MAESVSTPTGVLDGLVNDATNPAQRAIDRFLERILTSGDVRRVFGEPVVQGDRTIIPVAQVRTMLGFGSGSGIEPSDGEGTADRKSGEGGGGGGGVRATPLGYIELTPGETRFVPIMDRTRLAITGIVAVTVLFIVRGPRWSSRRKRSK